MSWKLPGSATSSTRATMTQSRAAGCARAPSRGSPDPGTCARGRSVAPRYSRRIDRELGGGEDDPGHRNGLLRCTGLDGPASSMIPPGRGQDRRVLARGTTACLASHAGQRGRQRLLSPLPFTAVTAPAPSRKESPPWHAEPADVLIVGAGASGGVVALRLAEAGFKVTCLEQGDWHDRAEYRGRGARLGADHAQAVVDEPQRPRPRRQDYPLDETDAESRRSCSAASAGRCSSSRAPGRGCCPPTSGSAASTGSPTTGRSPTTSCCPYYERTRPRSSASRAWAATRPTRPAARIRRCRRCRWARAGSRSPGRTPGSAGTGGRSSTRSCRRRTTAAGRASSAAPASRAATRAPRRRPT